MVIDLWVEKAPHYPLVLEIGGMGAALVAHRVFVSFSMSTTTVVIDSFICWIYLFLISLSSQYESLDSSYFEVSPAKSTHVLYVVSICRGVPMSFYQQLLARHTH